MQNWKVSCRPVGGGAADEVILPNTEKKHTFHNLSPGKEYIFSVTGQSCGHKDIRTCMKSKTAILKYIMEHEPLKTEIIADYNSIELSWALSDQIGSESEGMRIKWRSKADADWLSKIVQAGETSVKIEGLTSKTFYNIEITTLCQEQGSANCNGIKTGFRSWDEKYGRQLGSPKIRKPRNLETLKLGYPKIMRPLNYETCNKLALTRKIRKPSNFLTQETLKEGKAEISEP